MFRVVRFATAILLVGIHAFALGFPLFDPCPDEADCEEGSAAAAACVLCPCCLDRSPADPSAIAAPTIATRYFFVTTPIEIAPPLPEPQDIFHVPKIYLA